MSYQLSAFRFRFRLPLSARTDYTDAGLVRSSGEYGPDSAAIRRKLVSKSSFQFGVFHADHHGACDDCEGGQQPADQQSSADTPCQQFAEVREIDGMPDT